MTSVKIVEIKRLSSKEKRNIYVKEERKINLRVIHFLYTNIINGNGMAYNKTCSVQKNKLTQTAVKIV